MIRERKMKSETIVRPIEDGYEIRIVSNEIGERNNPLAFDIAFKMMFKDKNIIFIIIA